MVQMTFDYQYIDPGPDDPGCTKNRYFALNVRMLNAHVVSFCTFLQQGFQVQ